MAVSANFDSLFHFDRTGTSVTLQSRTAVCADFGLVDVPKWLENGFQNVPVLACERTCVTGYRDVSAGLVALIAELIILLSIPGTTKAKDNPFSFRKFVARKEKQKDQV